MALCYWTKCSCPNQQPCAEHAGWNCGRWGNVVVTDVSVIDDTVTRDAERALVALDQNRQRVETFQRDLEQKRAELELERREVERMLGAARSMGERRVAARRLEAAYDRLPQLNQQLQQVLSDLAVLTSRASAIGGAISTYLIVPYSNPTGYCTCYDDKRGRLAALAGPRSQHQATLSSLLAQRGSLMAQVTPTFSSVPSHADPIKVILSISVAAALILFIISGAGAAIIGFLLGIILLNILLFSTALSVMDIDRQVMVVRSRIVALDLQYYRLQQITTCQQPPAAPPLPPGTTPAVSDENAWWVELTRPQHPASEDD